MKRTSAERDLLMPACSNKKSVDGGVMSEKGVAVVTQRQTSGVFGGEPVPGIRANEFKDM